MSVLMERNDQVCTLRIDGEMTIYTAAEQRTALFAAWGDCAELELDLAAVGEIDSAGLQILLMLKREVEAAGRVLRLSNHSQAVFEVLELLDMQAHFGDPVIIPAGWTAA